MCTHVCGRGSSLWRSLWGGSCQYFLTIANSVGFIFLDIMQTRNARLSGLLSREQGRKLVGSTHLSGTLACQIEASEKQAFVHFCFTTLPLGPGWQAAFCPLVRRVRKQKEVPGFLKSPDRQSRAVIRSSFPSRPCSQGRLFQIRSSEPTRPLSPVKQKPDLSSFLPLGVGEALGQQCC